MLSVSARSLSAAVLFLSYLAIFCFTETIAAAPAAAETVDCLALLAKDRLSFKGSSAEQIAWLSSLDSTQYKNYRDSHNAGGSVSYGLFSLGADASFESFLTELSTVKSSVSYNYSSAQTQSIVTESTPAGAIDGYIKCLEDQSPGVYVIPTARIDNALALKVAYKSPGAPIAEHIKLHLTGGTGDQAAVDIPNEGSQTVSIKRDGLAPGLLVVANGTGGSVLSDSYPAVWDPKVDEPKKHPPTLVDQGTFSPGAGFPTDQYQSYTEFPTNCKTGTGAMIARVPFSHPLGTPPDLVIVSIIAIDYHSQGGSITLEAPTDQIAKDAFSVVVNTHSVPGGACVAAITASYKAYSF